MKQTKTQEIKEVKEVCPLNQKIETVYDHLSAMHNLNGKLFNELKSQRKITENLIKLLINKKVIKEEESIQIYGGKEE